MEYEGIDRRSHCENHDEFHETLTKVALNTDWIIRALKVGGSVLGTVIVVIVIPVSIWLVNLDKRVANLETRLTLHISPEEKK